MPHTYAFLWVLLLLRGNDIRFYRGKITKTVPTHCIICRMSATDVGGIQFFKPIRLRLEKNTCLSNFFLTFSCYIKNIFTIFALDITFFLAKQCSGSSIDAPIDAVIIRFSQLRINVDICNRI